MRGGVRVCMYSRAGTGCFGLCLLGGNGIGPTLQRFLRVTGAWHMPGRGSNPGSLVRVMPARSTAFGGRSRVTLVLGFFARLLRERGLLPRCLWKLAAALWHLD